MLPPRANKTQVPDWLNSTLWSSPRSPPSPFLAQAKESSPPEPLAEHKQPQLPQNNTAHIVDEQNSECSHNGLLGEHSFSSRDELSKETFEEAERPLGQDSLPPLKEEIADILTPDAPVLSSSPPPSPSPPPVHQIPPVAAGPSSIARCSTFDSRVSQFNEELSRKTISIGELRQLASQGIPECGSIRATTWKLLLGYLPKSRDLWSVEFSKKRAEYASFKEELLVTPTEIIRKKEPEGSERLDEGLMPRHDITHEDHPLSLGKTSVWHQFFVDSEICEQIDRDVKRTHPDMQFFCGDSAVSLDNQESMKRVLFIFAKLNPGIRYVQGMNEVLAPLYYVFRTDTDEANAAHAEADSFFCFVALLGDFRDHFVQQLDNSAVGIRSTIAQLNDLLKQHDEELWRHLEFTSKVNPQFYAFRWITLLLTQEFDFPDTLRLWDSLLGNPDGPLEILLRVCCAMLLSVRSRLLAGDFTSNLKLLQHYPSIDIHLLLRVAGELKAKNFPQ